MNSWPGAVTLVSVSVERHAVGSAWPSTHVLNWMVEPTTRSRSHCLAVDTELAPDTDRRLVDDPFTTRFTVTVLELDESSTPYPLTGRYELVQPPEPRVNTLK